MTIGAGIGRFVGERLAENLGLMEKPISREEYMNLARRHDALVQQLNNTTQMSTQEIDKLKRELEFTKESLSSAHYYLEQASRKVEIKNSKLKTQEEKLEAIFQSLSDDALSGKTAANAYANEFIKKHAIQSEGLSKEEVKLHDINVTVKKLSPNNHWKANLIRLAILEMEQEFNMMSMMISPLGQRLQEKEGYDLDKHDDYLAAYHYALENVSRFQLSRDNIKAWLNERLPVLAKEVKPIAGSLYPDPKTIPPHSDFEKLLQKAEPDFTFSDNQISGHTLAISKKDQDMNFIP